MSPPSLDGASIELLWIPLGAGGSGFVRLNGRVYERISAAAERRTPLDLYHTALMVRSSAGAHVIETMWPSPPGDPASRGVVVQGAVFAKALSGLRTFRYEVRCWRDGVLPDADRAVGGPQRLSDDPVLAQRVLALTATVPALTWGRDQSKVGDMWNSNSVIAWLLARAGIPMGAVIPPTGGRAPGWVAGLRVADADPEGVPSVQSPRPGPGE